MAGTATPDVVTVRVPLRLRRHGGCKFVMAPAQATAPPAAPDNTLIKALARAHRWRRMMESGAYDTLAALAEAEKTNPSYLSRIMRLSLLAPDIVEAILDGSHPRELKLADLMAEHPNDWCDQRRVLGMIRHRLNEGALA